MRPSRRVLTERNRVLGASIERVVAERDDAQEDVCALSRQLLRVSGELSRVKDVLAEHIVAAKGSSSALSDAHSVAISLQEALDARGIDLRIELARLEGAEL